MNRLIYLSQLILVKQFLIVKKKLFGENKDEGLLFNYES